MKTILISLGCLSLPASLFSAEIISTFNVPGGGSWETAGNWSPSGIPSNTVTNQYQVILPPGLAAPVVMANTRTVNNLTVGAGSTLRFGTFVQLGFSGDSVNNGVMDFGPIGGTTSGLLINDPVDQSVSLSGSGRVLFSGSTASITGASGQTLIHGAGHRVEGFGNLGVNLIQIVNRGTVLGNSAAGPLTVDPLATFVNDGGSVRAEAPGSLRFNPGIYSATNGGAYEIGDGARLILSEGTALRDLAIRPRDIDANPANNILSVTGIVSTSASNVTLATSTVIDTFARLVLAGDVTNEGRISVTGAGGTLYGLHVDDPVDGIVTLRGPGSLVLVGGTHSVTATGGQTFTQASDHTIEGQGRIGGGSANIINRGLIHGNAPGSTLTIDPVTTFHNDGGTVTASNAGVVRLSAPAITQAGGGKIVVPDASVGTIQFNFSSLTGGVIDRLDGNNNLDDNAPTLLQNLTLRNLENRVALGFPAGRKLTLEGEIANAGSIKITGTGQLQLPGAGVADEVIVSGAGLMELSTREARILGTGTLVNGPGHMLRMPTSPIRTLAETPPPGVRRIRNEGVIELYPTAVLSDIEITVPLFERISQTAGVLKLGGLGLTRNGQTPDIFVEDGEVHAVGLAARSTLELKPESTLDRPTLKPGGDAIGGFGTSFFEGSNIKLHPGARLEMQVDSSTSFDFFGPDRGGATINGGPELIVDYRGNSTTFPAGATVSFMSSRSGQIFPDNPLPGSLPPDHEGGGFIFEFSNIAPGGRIVAKAGNASFLFNYVRTVGVNGGDPRNSAAWLSAPQFGPEFTGTPYAFSIPATSAPGTAVGTVTAVDPEAGAVQYSLAAGSPFAIHPSTGAITVSGPLPTAGQSLYSLTVTASDGVLFNRTTVSVSVTGLPVNNASCVFTLLTGPGGPFAGQSDPAVVGFSADPDKDGLGNVFELWLGTNPAVLDAGGDLTLKLFPNGASSSVALEVSVKPAVDDLLKVGGFLSHELTAFRAGTRSVLSETGGVRRLRFLDPLPAPGSRGFGQLRADPSAAKP